MPSKLLAVVILVPCALTASGQTIAAAYCGQDGKANVEYADHSTRTVDPEPDQVGCADMSISDDRRSFGWSVQVKNCCTSYPISIAIVVVRDANKALFQPGQAVWRWRFIDHGNRIAILSGPVHGNASEATLYDIRSRKQLETWAGSGNAPAWADGWQEEFASDTEHP